MKKKIISILLIGMIMCIPLVQAEVEDEKHDPPMSIERKAVFCFVNSIVNGIRETGSMSFCTINITRNDNGSIDVVPLWFFVGLYDLEDGEFTISTPTRTYHRDNVSRAYIWFVVFPPFW